MTPKMILLLVLIGVFSFAALITLSGYAGDLRQKDNGQAHALSRSAIGYAGLVRLLGDMDYEVRMARSENVSVEDQHALRVYTLSRPFQADGLDELSLDTPSLIIMPKWITMPAKDNPGWVRRGWGEDATFEMSHHERDLKELLGKVDFERHNKGDKSASYSSWSKAGDPLPLNGIKIENLQTIDGSDLQTLLTVEEGSVLVKIEDTSTYILSDPDFMNTMGISRRTRAQFAVDLIDAIIVDADADPMRVDFDLTFHGFGGNTNIIKVLTQPPFLAATLCLLAAGFLIAWQAFSRFGDPVKPQRDYALGKFSLADNAARFIRIAGREPNMATDYAALVRMQVIKELDLTGRSQKDIKIILDRREQSLNLVNAFSALESQLNQTKDKAALLSLAKDLDNWKTKMILGNSK